MLLFLSSYHTELMSLFQLLIGWLFLFLCAFRYGKPGIYIYITVAVILSNLQVMKFGQFFWSEHPVALGTIVFASTFLATDILNEFYSAESARLSVTLGFLGFALLSILMLLHIWIPAVSESALAQNNLIDGHQAMVQLFTPMPTLYLASIISYFISERIDITLYSFFKKLTDGTALWFRSIAASTISAFIDTVIFSVLAWKVCAVQPVGWSVLFFTYVLGSFWPRILVSITGVPILYILKRYRSRWISQTNDH